MFYKSIKYVSGHCRTIQKEIKWHWNKWPAIKTNVFVNLA